MNVLLFQSADIPQLVNAIKQLPRQENDLVLLLIGEKLNLDLQTLLTAVNQENIQVAGGVFPGVIHGSNNYDSAVVAAVLPMMSAPFLVTGLETSNFTIGDLKLNGAPLHTALVLVDGLTGHIALFLERLFAQTGNRVQYIGGGAGSLSFVQKPCIFDNRGVYQDAALVLRLRTWSAPGIRHGWRQIRGPFIATHTEGTKIHKFSNQPALKIYRQTIGMMTGKTLTLENFFEIAKEYPLGIYYPGMDYIVRDPLTFTEEGSLVCVGEVPPHSLVYVLKGDRKNLIHHAKLAISDALKEGEGNHHLVIDCISRALYLEEDFPLELRAVSESLSENAAPPWGMLSLGEIASYKTGKVEFFNKTMVVGALQNL